MFLVLQGIGLAVYHSSTRSAKKVIVDLYLPPETFVALYDGTANKVSAVTRDGRRVLVMETGSQSQGELVLVQNFFEELKALGR